MGSWEQGETAPPQSLQPELTSPSPALCMLWEHLSSLGDTISAFHLCPLRRPQSPHTSLPLLGSQREEVSQSHGQ